ELEYQWTEFSFRLNVVCAVQAEEGGARGRRPAGGAGPSGGVLEEIPNGTFGIVMAVGIGAAIRATGASAANGDQPVPQMAAGRGVASKRQQSWQSAP